MHYIYCLTNVINNKKYIGRTNDLTRRMNQHKNDSVNSVCANKYKTPLALAIQKYGWEAFKMDVLAQDEDAEIINQLEIEFIEKFNTYGKDGYNASRGGEFGYAGRVYEHTLSEEQLSNLIEDLKNNITQQAIAKKYGISATYVSDINNGRKLKRDNEMYPLQSANKDSIFELYPNIIKDLQQSSESMRAISRKYGVSQEVVRKINSGQTKRAHLFVQNFPIRK